MSIVASPIDKVIREIDNNSGNAEYDGRYYIILSRVTGQTFKKAWPTMDEAIRQYHASRAATTCKELAVWQADSISGVDG